MVDLARCVWFDTSMTAGRWCSRPCESHPSLDPREPRDSCASCSKPLSRVPDFLRKSCVYSRGKTVGLRRLAFEADRKLERSLAQFGSAAIGLSRRLPELIRRGIKQEGLA